jgi:hypothetical protein
MIHTLLFTGHMIDAPQRKVPRFPAAKEATAREEIRNCLTMEASLNLQLTGIAGAASGGDILFHEVCEELSIPSQIYLALPVDEYKKASVSFAGGNWEVRFERLLRKLPVHFLTNANSTLENDNVWERANLWMLGSALANGGNNMSLIALWDGKGGDGTGGTEHMVTVAKAEGAKSIIIDTNNL